MKTNKYNDCAFNTYKLTCINIDRLLIKISFRHVVAAALISIKKNKKIIMNPVHVWIRMIIPLPRGHTYDTSTYNLKK